MPSPKAMPSKQDLLRFWTACLVCLIDVVMLRIDCVHDTSMLRDEIDLQ